MLTLHVIVHAERVMRNSGRVESGEAAPHSMGFTRPPSARARLGWRHEFNGRIETGFPGGSAPATKSESLPQIEFPGSGYGLEG